MTHSSIKDFWERNVPMGFRDKPLSYEEKRQFRYALQEYMAKAYEFSDFGGKSVLDLGCGSGIDSAEFLRNGASVVSVDLTKNGTMQTRDLFNEARVKGDIVRGSATHLPFRSDVFDCVYCFGVLHHIPNIDNALYEINRVLQRKGKFMGMLYNRNSLLYALLSLRWGTDAVAMTERVPNCPYAKPYSQHEAWCLLSAYFNKVEVQPRYNVIDTPKQRKVKFSLENGDSAFGWHLVVKGTKA